MSDDRQKLIQSRFEEVRTIIFQSNFKVEEIMSILKGLGDTFNALQINLNLPKNENNNNQDNSAQETTTQTGGGLADEASATPDKS
jgi:hypothetical protein